MKIINCFVVSLFFLIPNSMFGDLNHFLPEEIKVDQNGILLNTPDLLKKGYSFDKKNGSVSKNNITYQVTKNEDGNFTFSQADINSLDSVSQRRFSRTAISNQMIRHIKFNNAQQVTAVIDCDSSAKYKFQLGNPFSLPISNSQQAACSVVTADACKIQADLLNTYFGNDQNKFFKQISECKDMLRKVNHINEQFSGSINLTDTEIDKLNSDLMKTSAANSYMGKFLGSKFVNTTQYKPSQGDSLEDVVRALDQMKESYSTCSQFKDQMAASSAKADPNFSQKTLKKPHPNELGKCPVPYIASDDKKECINPTCSPGTIFDEVALMCKKPQCPPGQTCETPVDKKTDVQKANNAR